MDTNKEPYTPLPLSPAILAGRRKALAAAIETLIDVLDVIDGDPDLEDDDPAGGNVTDEPHDPHEDGL